MDYIPHPGVYIAPNLKVVELKPRSSILQNSRPGFDGRTDTNDWWQEQD